MQYAVSLPNFDVHADPRVLARLARDAEAAGWDGFFIWDHILFDPYGGIALSDPWVALAAIALGTERIRIGTMVTPLPRRRPWKLAREAVSLDHLSGGRLILGVGLGDPVREEFAWLGEETDNRVRAKKLDEGLAIVTGLWSGEKFAYEGEQYQVKETIFLPRPVQSPRIPIWVAGAWPTRRRSAAPRAGTASSRCGGRAGSRRSCCARSSPTFGRTAPARGLSTSSIAGRRRATTARPAPRSSRTPPTPARPGGSRMSACGATGPGSRGKSPTSGPPRRSRGAFAKGRRGCSFTTGG